MPHSASITLQGSEPVPTAKGLEKFGDGVLFVTYSVSLFGLAGLAGPAALHSRGCTNLARLHRMCRLLPHAPSPHACYPIQVITHSIPLHPTPPRAAAHFWAGQQEGQGG